jgi:hypothetical protein
VVWAFVVSPTYVRAHLFSGDVSERVIKRLDVLGCPFAKLRKIQARILNMSTHRQIRTVDLQIETRGHDGLVFEPHGRHAGARLRLLRGWGRCERGPVRPFCPKVGSSGQGADNVRLVHLVRARILAENARCRRTVEFIPVRICLISAIGTPSSAAARPCGNASVMPPYSS